MKQSNLVSSTDGDQFYASLYSISNSLYKLILHQNRIFAKGETIPVTKFQQYNQLKSELLVFLSDFRSRGSSSYKTFGGIQNKLNYEDNQVARLEKTSETISKIIDDLIDKN